MKSASLVGKWKLANMVLILKKVSNGDLVAIVLELNTFIDTRKNRISEYMDKYVVMERVKLFF